MAASGDPTVLEGMFAENTKELTEQELAESLERAGYIVTKPRPQDPIFEFDLDRIKGRKRVRLAVVSDTHMCSTYQQITYLHEFYEYAAKEAKVDAFLHCGDFTDGTHHYHKGSEYELFRLGYDAQRDYCVEAYPHARRNLKTYVIGGNHDASTHTHVGADIVNDICSRRDDLEYLGDQTSAYMDFENVRVLLQHPYIGGNTITLSRPAQRLIEMMAPEHKPHLMFIGNFHKAFHLPAYRNVEAFQMPAFQSTTAWMRGKGINSIVGAWIVEFGLDPAGLAGSLKTERVIFHRPMPDDFPS